MRPFTKRAVKAKTITVLADAKPTENQTSAPTVALICGRSSQRRALDVLRNMRMQNWRREKLQPF